MREKTDVPRRPFKPYRFILGPEQLTLYPGRRVGSPADYLSWHTTVVTMRGGDAWDSPTPTEAKINHGRWVAECVWCGTGMLTRPEWKVAYCGECGARYHNEQVEFPADFLDIEAALLVRVRRDQQNWDKRQDVEALRDENKLPEVVTP